MALYSYASNRTGLLLVDPYNDVLSEGGKLWLQAKAVAEAINLLTHLRALVEVTRRLEEYLREPNYPLFLWLRLIVGERLLKLHRHHLGTHLRDAAVEVSLYRAPLPAASSAALAAQLLGRLTSPTQAAIRAERLLRVQEAVNALEPIDREIIALRNFEEMSRVEAACALGIEEAAAAKRYIRAIRRLRAALESLGDDVI